MTETKCSYFLYSYLAVKEKPLINIFFGHVLRLLWKIVICRQYQCSNPADPWTGMHRNIKWFNPDGLLSPRNIVLVLFSSNQSNISKSSTCVFDVVTGVHCYHYIDTIAALAVWTLCDNLTTRVWHELLLMYREPTLEKTYEPVLTFQ